MTMHAHPPRRRRWIAAAAGAAVTLTLAACSDGEATAARSERGPTPVRAATVDTQTFTAGIEALGTARANESVAISATITEKLVALDFADGEPINEGHLIARLDDRAERAELAAAKARLAERQRALSRSRDLVRDRVLSEAEADLRAAEVETARAEVEALEAVIDDHAIRAPFAGRVGLRQVSVGALIRPGDVITTLDDLSVIKVDFTVPETELARLDAGVPLIARTAAYPERDFRGEVAAVGTQVNPATRAVTARALIPNADGALQPGMLITLELLARERMSPAIPEAALVPRGDKQFVFRIDGETAQRVAVTIGTRRPGVVEIISGLEAGDVVVTDGTLKLQPGAKVTVQDDGAADEQAS